MGPGMAGLRRDLAIGDHVAVHQRLQDASNGQLEIGPGGAIVAPEIMALRIVAIGGIGHELATVTTHDPRSGSSVWTWGLSI